MSSENQPSKSPKEMFDEAASSIPRGGILYTLKHSLKEGIKSGVETTNKLLASMEASTEKARKPIVSTVQNLEKEGKHVAHEVSHLYAIRHEYGPQIIAGAFLLGGLVGLRRGRIPAAITGSLTGFAGYLGVYQVDIRELPNHVLKDRPF